MLDRAILTLIEKADDQPMPDGVLLASDVKKAFGGISDATLSRWVRDEHMQFPAPIMLNSRLRAWRISHLLKYLIRLTGQRDGKAIEDVGE